MKRISILLLIILLGCKPTASNFEKYGSIIGFDTDIPTLIVSLENCQYCFSVFKESIQELEGKEINVIIVSAQEKKANLLAKVDGKSIFIDQKKEGLKLGLIESLPVLFLPGQEKETIETPDELVDLIQKYVQ
jgi:thioredoxin-related protein